MADENIDQTNNEASAEGLGAIMEASAATAPVAVPTTAATEGGPKEVKQVQQIAMSAEDKAKILENMKLKDGRKFIMNEGIALDAIKASKACDGDEEYFAVACMCELVELDGGGRISVEQLLDGPSADYLAVQSAFSAVNFPSGEPGVLSDGRKYEITVGTGRDVIFAQREADGKQERVLFSMMRRQVKVEGMPMMIEDFELLPIGDFLKLRNEFGETNF